MKKILKNTAERAARYLEELEQRRVAPEPNAVRALERLQEPLPQEPSDPEHVLELLDTICSPATVASAGGRYFGFVIGGSLPSTLAASWLTSAWDQNGFAEPLSPATYALERVAGEWVKEAMDLPRDAATAFVTGATMANFTGLLAARQAVLGQVGWDVGNQGLFGAPEITVLVGAEVHPTVLKALAMLGLGRKRVQVVDVDNQGRFKLGAMPTIKGPTIVCVQAGNVNSGAFDPIGEICEAVKGKAWVHVDGAFGLWAAASLKLAGLLKGVDRADSWAVDGHKWLNVPYDCGIAVVKDREALADVLGFSTSYLPTGLSLTPESSRRPRGVEVWAALKSLGRSGLGEMIERNCTFARRFAEGFTQAGYEILNDVVLNQVLVHFGDQQTTDRIIKTIQEEGTCWCGGTVWQGRPAMRISVSSWATTADDVAASLAAMLRIAKEQAG
jgi:glutamate/tyrosine decarboxylase-like PLP-dependent enzyme